MFDCKEYFETEYTPIEWTPKTESNFFQAVFENKLDGRNRNFLMLAVLQRFKEMTGVNAPSIQLWDKLLENLNLDYADKTWNQRNPPKIKDPIYLLNRRPEMCFEMEKRLAAHEKEAQAHERSSHSAGSTPKTGTPTMAGGKSKKIKDELSDDSLSHVQTPKSGAQESTKTPAISAPKSKGSVGRPKKGDITPSAIKSELAVTSTPTTATASKRAAASQGIEMRRPTDFGSVSGSGAGGSTQTPTATSAGSESAPSNPRRSRKASSSVSKSEIDDLTNSIEGGKHFTESESVISSDTASTSSKHDEAHTGERPPKRGKFSARHSAANTSVPGNKSSPPKGGSGTTPPTSGPTDNTMIKKLRGRVSTSGSVSTTHAGKKRK